MRKIIKIFKGVRSLKNEKRNSLTPILTYIIMFFIIWSVYEIMIATNIKDIYSENLNVFLNFIIKTLIWILPVYLYLKFYDRTNPISYLKLDKNIKNGLIGALILSLFFTFYHFTRINLLGSGSGIIN